MTEGEAQGGLYFPGGSHGKRDELDFFWTNVKRQTKDRQKPELLCTWTEWWEGGWGSTRGAEMFDWLMDGGVAVPTCGDEQRGSLGDNTLVTLVHFVPEEHFALIGRGAPCLV